jgi:hypothetical protein
MRHTGAARVSVFLLVASGCGSGGAGPSGGADAAPGGGTSPPCASLAGTWEAELLVDGSACGWDADEETATWTITQTGCTAELRDDNLDRTFPVAIDGNNVSVTGSFREDGLTFNLTTERLTVSGDTFTGKLRATAQSGSCVLQITITASRKDGPVTTVDAGPGSSDTPTTLSALAVGYWSTVGHNCPTGSQPELSGYVYALCPGGRIRGAGRIGSATSLECGSYTTSPRTAEGCNDRFNCFDKIAATVRNTLVLGGQTDVSNVQVSLYFQSDRRIFRATTCSPSGNGLLFLDRVVGTATDNDCVSAACPAAGGSSSDGYGSCGTDCDCGRCWYCDKSGGSGTCRYGGEGPYGCYRGCGL